MGLLQDLMAWDAANVFGDADGHAEQVTYNANARGTVTQVTFTTNVYRFPPQDLPGGGVASAFIELDVPVSIVATINKNGDTVTVADKQGGTATAHPVNEVVSQDAGLRRVRLR